MALRSSPNKSRHYSATPINAYGSVEKRDYQSLSKKVWIYKKHPYFRFPTSRSSLRTVFTRLPTESSVGTREGFYCFNEKDKQIKRYNTTNGLPNNVVYGILEDSFGRLWLSTNRGIPALIRKRKNSVTLQNRTGCKAISSIPLLIAVHLWDKCILAVSTESRLSVRNYCSTILIRLRWLSPNCNCSIR